MYDEIADAYQEWIGCAESGGTDCHLSTRVPFALAVSAAIVASSFGGVAVYMFGLHRGVISFWGRKLTKVCLYSYYIYLLLD